MVFLFAISLKLNKNQMSNLISKLENHLNEKSNNVVSDADSLDYLGCSFKISSMLFLYRKAKITPKKIGCFVAVWKRDADRKTVPFELSDDFNFYLIEVEDNNNKGFFIFPKSILTTNGVLSTDKEGKRGFRLYPTWTNPENKQATKSQLWQIPFFINLNETTGKLNQQIQKIFELYA